MTGKKKSYQLSEWSIDQISEEFADSLREVDADPKDIIRLRISLEEILVSYLKVLPGAPVLFYTGKRLGRPVIGIQVKGRQVEYREDDEEYELSSHLLSQAGVTLATTYEKGANCLTVYPAKKHKLSQIAQLLIAIAAGIICGLLQNLLPQGAAEAINSFINPTSTMLLNLLRVVSTPMIFLSICCGIFSLGDVSLMSRIGKSVIPRVMLLMLVVDILECFSLSFFFPVEVGGSAFSLQSFEDVFSIIIGIVPSDIITPFATGNTLQVIFLASAFGVGILILNERVSLVRDVMVQLYDLLTLLMKSIGRLIPLFVFLSMFSLTSAGIGAEARGIIKAMLLCLAGCVLVMLAFITTLSIRHKVPFGTLVHKLLPTFLIALTTASSAASFATNLETCENKLGIQHNLTGFMLPIGLVLCTPGTILAYQILCLCMAESNGLAITPVWLFSLVLVTELLAVATPPIPGGPLTVYTVLFSQLGIPLDSLAMAAAISSFIDFLITPADIACLQVEVVMTAGRLGMLDEECLRSPDVPS